MGWPPAAGLGASQRGPGQVGQWSDLIYSNFIVHRFCWFKRQAINQAKCLGSGHTSWKKWEGVER